MNWDGDCVGWATTGWDEVLRTCTFTELITLLLLLLLIRHCCVTFVSHSQFSIHTLSSWNNVAFVRCVFATILPIYWEKFSIVSTIDEAKKRRIYLFYEHRAKRMKFGVHNWWFKHENGKQAAEAPATKVHCYILTTNIIKNVICINWIWHDF